MMYYYWVHRGVRPKTFYGMGPGELAVVRAFYLQEQEDRERMMKSKSAFPVVPFFG